MKIKANVKKAKSGPVEEKIKDLAELSIGAKGYSSIKITSPFKLNEEGDLDVILDFSGIKLEIFFKVGLSKDTTQKATNKELPLLPRIEISKKIEF